MPHTHPPSIARRFTRVVLLLLLLGPAAQASPRAEAAPDGSEMRIAGQLLVDRTGARSARVGVLFQLDPGWHLYWRNPGDTGLAPRFRWRAPGAEMGDLEWPLPRRFVDEEVDLVSYGYQDRVLIAAAATWPTAALADRIGVEVDVLVCAEQCIPGSLALEAAIPALGSAPAGVRALFTEWAARVPVPAEQRGVHVRRVPAAPASGPYRLAVDACPDTADADCSFTRDAAATDFVFYPYSQEDPEHLHGVVQLAAADGTRVGVEIDLSRESAKPTPAAPAPPEPRTGLLRAALLGFLGGLLLNLMPCVLPVLALKVFALADLASRSRRAVAAHVGGYTAGILLAMALLAGCVVGLRAVGVAVGWGFHLQEPLFVVAVCALLVTFAANLFGVFEIQLDTTRLAGVGADAAGAARSFFDGLLAVVLATPCSAPFLGTAVGFAFASSGAVIGIIFLSIGAGLAAPFALVATVPPLRRCMPRSGPWMLHLRSGLGFALLGSVVWLLWVLGRATGTDAMAGALAVLVAVGLVTWIFGLLQRVGRPLPVPVLILVVVAVGVGGVDVVDFTQPEVRPVEASGAAVTAWNPEGVEAALRDGRPAFVYFTADWCITCKLNESRVLTDPRVERAFKALRIPVFRGDWTRRDESIRQALAGLGKAGVPAYAVYQPGAERPLILPELLSVDGLLGTLSRAAADADAQSAQAKADARRARS